MVFCLEGHHPVHSKGEYSMGPGLNVTFVLLRLHSAGLDPWSAYVYEPLSFLNK